MVLVPQLTKLLSRFSHFEFRSMASSSNQYGATAAPPPTPSTQPNLFSSSDAADSLSRLLHRQLPPILSPPSRRKSPTAITSTPVISLLDQQLSLSSKLLSASRLGFFQLTDHSIPSQLAHSAESESLSLFRLPNDQKQLSFPQNWPLGYDGDKDDDDEENGGGESFYFDSSCSTESADLSLTSLREFTRQMEKIGLAVIEALSCAVGFENPVRADSSRVNSLMWISEDTTGNKTVNPGKFYPYVVGLHYQIKCRKLSMLSDSGWISVLPQVDSIMITLGDIAQVWSNGKLKKVRGRPVPCSIEGDTSLQSISMSLLVTLPLDSIVFPILIPSAIAGGDEIEIKEDTEKCDNPNPKAVEASTVQFNSFSFEDYAWRVYHERLIFKDPLDRYRA